MARYLMLDKNDITEVCGVISRKDVIEEVGKSEFYNILNIKNHFFREKYVLVEDIEEVEKEIIFPFEIGKKGIYFVTSYGKFYIQYHKSKKIKYLKPYNKDGNLAVKINSKVYLCKNLIAELFAEEWNPGDVVLQKDNRNDNFNLDNLVVVPKERYAVVTGALSKSQAVGLYEDNQLVKKWSSARKCAKDMYCSYQTIMDYCNKKVKKPMFDVRWI